MISYCPDGTVQTKINICSCEHCLRGRFFDCLDEKGNNDIPYSKNESADETDSDTDESDNDFDSNHKEKMERYEIRSNNVIDIMEQWNVIALYSPSTSLELFYLCKVIDFGVAECTLQPFQRNVNLDVRF